jgi:uncharacterized protein
MARFPRSVAWGSTYAPLLAICRHKKSAIWLAKAQAAVDGELWPLIIAWVHTMDARGDLEEICRRHRVRLLIQFGSTVSGVLHQRSDLDLAALLEPDTAPIGARFHELYIDLGKHFPGQQLDLALINTADPLFLKKILEQSRLLCGSPRRFAELRAYGYRRYQDHKRYLSLERAYVRRALGENR